ncbi:class II glutamine amidotransferase [Actinomadura decatromicini]|uniref:Class II glutamine amidotransferase n=1 Tax=Actinomadura decatromicini TaxID=2604572 RepID=A0A5D3F643_9ACTN|nr:class II glutamine amidotransferase [Actinomadura decatromicini]TYK42815.1 class II glutamine amidotransferase [Actinomadura decatromicini]
MCRLFGMSTGGPRVRASHWLLDAPRSLRAQSHRMRHGAGLGWFSLGGEPVRDRSPLAAFENADFDMHARNIPSHTFVAHVRDASVGGLTVRNCHPFVMEDRLFAHNGVVKGLNTLARWLTEVERARIAGETDSELVFAYVTAEIRRHRDTTAGLVEAVQRIGAELPVFSLNLLIAESGRLWALRYPESNELWVLSPDEGGVTSVQGTATTGEASTSKNEGSLPAVVIASEPMDDRPGWRLLDPGELLVVEGLAETSHFPFAPLSHPVRRSELSLREAASQQVGPSMQMAPSAGTAAKQAVSGACRHPGDTDAPRQPDEMADSGPMPH